MTDDVIVKKPVSVWKLRFMGAFAAGSAFLVAAVSAGALNDSVSPLLYELPALFTGLVALIIAAVPIENLSLNITPIGDSGLFGFVFGDYHCACDCGVPSRSVRRNPW